MAERIVSPGVFTRENDLSFLAQGIGEIGAAFIGPLKEGPAFVPTIVRSRSEFNEIFGTPDGTYYTDYAVENYLREAGTATIVRVAGVGGYQQLAPLAIVATGSLGKRIIATIHSTQVGDDGVGFPGATTTVTALPQSGSFAVSGASLSGSFSSSIFESSPADIEDVFGTSPFGLKTAYVYTYFKNATLNFTGSAADEQGIGIEELNLPTQDFAYNAEVASTPWVKSQKDQNNIRYDLFRFHTIGHGNLYNTKFKVGISNVKAAGEDGSTDYATFTITIRSFGDTDKRKSVIETYTNINLDPASPNYIAKRIGDRYMTIGLDGKITEYGDYSNKSKYIRIEVKEQGSFPISAAPFGHGAYINPIKTNNSTEADYVPAVVYQTGSANNTSSSPVYYAGFDFESVGVSVDNKNYLKPIPNGALVGANVDFAFDSQLNYQMTGSVSSDMVKRQFVLGFQSGFDGVNPTLSVNLGANISAANTQGFNCATSTTSGSVAYNKAIAAISNSDEYDINMVVTPGIVRRLHPAITTNVIDMVESRQDCFYIADFNAVDDTITLATEQSNSVDSNYVATYYPWVKTVDTNTNKLILAFQKVIKY
jgi:hypothetical protein